MYMPEFYEYFKNRWPNFNIWNNIAHYPKWLTCAVLPTSAKKEITKKLQAYNFGHYRSEIDSLIDYMNTPLFSNGSSVPDNIKSRFNNERLLMMDQRNIEKKYDTFKNQIAGGDVYRQESFTEVFPELHELLKDSYDYDQEIETVSTLGFKKLSVEEYG